MAPVVEFDSDDEAIGMANDTVHGLIAYVYTGDLARGLRTAEALESGMVGLNRASCPTRPPRSAASSNPASAAKGVTRASRSSSRPSTSPPVGDRLRHRSLADPG